jgi:hypothetical protein
MDLALLVYIISLLHGIGVFFLGLIALCVFAVIANGIYYVDYCDNGTDLAKRTIGRMWKAFWVAVVAAWVLILLPNEKTAYTMVGAYAAQKVSENDKVQQMSGRVLTIIEQKLDGYIEDGINEAKKKIEDQAEETVGKKKKRKE